MHVGECFVLNPDADDESHQVGSIIKPAWAYRIESVDSDTLVALSATGERQSFPRAREVMPIPRGGYERLSTLQREAVERRRDS